MDHDRIAALEQSLPFYTWYARSPHIQRAGQPGVIDLLFGNPHDMPMPAYVEAIRRHSEPRDPSWYVYMLDHPPATEAVARDLAAHTGILVEQHGRDAVKRLLQRRLVGVVARDVLALPEAVVLGQIAVDVAVARNRHADGRSDQAVRLARGSFRHHHEGDLSGLEQLARERLQNID